MEKITGMMDRGEKAVPTAGITATSGPTTTISTTPNSGLFSPATAALRREMAAKVEDATPLTSPFLHALQMQKIQPVKGLVYAVVDRVLGSVSISTKLWRRSALLVDCTRDHDWLNVVRARSANAMPVRGNTRNSPNLQLWTCPTIRSPLDPPLLTGDPFTPLSPQAISGMEKFVVLLAKSVTNVLSNSDDGN